MSEPRRQSSTGTVVTVLIAGLAIGFAPGCSVPDREAQLRDTIRAMARSLEQHEPGGFLAHVADDFSGERGAWSAAEVKRFVLGQAVRKEPVTIRLGDMDLTVREDRATAIVTARVSGGRGWVPRRGEGYRFETGWRLEGGDWMVIRADWERLP